MRGERRRKATSMDKPFVFFVYSFLEQCCVTLRFLLLFLAILFPTLRNYSLKWLDLLSLSLSLPLSLLFLFISLYYCLELSRGTSRVRRSLSDTKNRKEER